MMNLLNSIPLRGNSSSSSGSSASGTVSGASGGHTYTHGKESGEQHSSIFEDKNFFTDIVEPPKFITG
jgi:hypothetical protein